MTRSLKTQDGSLKTHDGHLWDQEKFPGRTTIKLGLVHLRDDNVSARYQPQKGSHIFGRQYSYL